MTVPIHKQWLSDMKQKDERIAILECQLAEAKAAICDFAEHSKWGYEGWKQEPHILKLLELADRHKPAAPAGEEKP